MKCIVLLTILGLFGKSAVEAFGAASTSNVRSISRSSADLDMKIFDWKQRELFENYKIPDGECCKFSVTKFNCSNPYRSEYSLIILILFYRPVSPFVCRQTSSSTSTQLHLFLDQGRSFYVLAEVFQQVKAKLAAEVCVVRNLGPVREEVSDLDSKEDRLLCTVVYLNLLASQ